MKRFRFSILLALSSLALLASLFLLWLSLDAPLPTAAAICARLDRERYVSGVSLLASGPIQYQDPAAINAPQNTWWFVGRNGDSIHFYTLEKLAGFLWRNADRAVRYDLSETEQSLFVRPMGTYFLGTEGTELTPVIVCTDPSVVRVEARLAHLGMSEQENAQAAMDRRGVSPDFTQVADGVWVSSSVTVPPSEENASSLTIWCRGYDAAGNLVCANPPDPWNEVKPWHPNHLIPSALRCAL